MKRTLAVAALMLLTATVMQAEIKFLRGPLKEAIAKANEEKKPVMIDFVTDWCRWCDTLDARTYSDTRVADFVNSKVVPIKIDAEKGEGVDIAKRYGVRAYPTILLISANGDEIDRLMGYMPPEPFLKTLGDYLKGENTITSLKADLEKNPNNAEMQYRMARKLVNRNDMASAAPLFKKMLDLDPNDSLKHSEEALYMLGMNALNTDKNPKELETFIQRYPASPASRQALGMLASSSIKEKKADDAKRFVNQYLSKWPEDAMAMNNFAWGYAEANLNLDDAAKLAEKAVGLATNDEEKAMYLDTQATVAFNQGDSDKAVKLEQQALALLKGAPEKTRKQYEETLAKFKAGKR